MTDAAGQYIIESTLWGKLMKQTKGPADPMRLEPRLIQKDKKLYVSFKTGAGRMFVVKNLEEFCEHVKNGEEAVYARQQSSAIKGKILPKALSHGWSL